VWCFEFGCERQGCTGPGSPCSLAGDGHGPIFSLMGLVRGPGTHSFSLRRGFMLACVVAILVSGPRRKKMKADETLLRVCASYWLCMLRARSSRRSLGLLESLGGLPWSFPWGTLWHGSVIYNCAPMFPQCSSFGPLAYVGEADNFARRINAHSCRLLSPTGSVQQPFFHFVRGDERSSYFMRLHICEWLFFPAVALAPGDSSARKVLEMEWIQGLADLVCLILQRCTFCFVIFILKESSRAFAYLDAGSLCADSEISPRAVHSGGMKTKLHRRLGNLACRRSLQRCGPSSVAAWRLSRAAWVYVVQRAVNHEAGWRRARALRMLRRIARVRKALPSPIAVISWDVPRVGSQRAQSLVTNAVRDLVASW
jgi:hypothetical protein